MINVEEGYPLGLLGFVTSLLTFTLLFKIMFCHILAGLG